MPEKTSPNSSGRAKPAGTRPDRTKTSVPRAKAAPKPEKATPGERIAKVLSRAGVASRREAERMIEAGEVQVNGKVITSAALNVTPTDKITVSGHLIGAPEPARLWLYYKPEGLVTSASDEKGRETVFDHLPEDMPRVMSIGRLDLNSEGLLLLTNDGTLKRQLELPSTGWLRKYRVRVKGNPTDPDLEPLRKGITVEGERFQPMEVMLDRHQGANAWLTIGLREGKNREIRRAINALGMIVNRLIRISYGPFRLNEMNPGDVEEVRSRILRDQLGALMPGASDADSDAPPSRPASKTVTKSGVRTSSRKGGDTATTRRTPQGSEDETRTPRAPRARPGEETRSPPKAGPKYISKTGPRGRSADEVAPGTMTTARGRAALGTLSDAWAKATTPARKTATPRRPKDTSDEAAPRSAPKPQRSRSAATPYITRPDAPKTPSPGGPRKPAGAAKSGPPKSGTPPTRRK